MMMVMAVGVRVGVRLRVGLGLEERCRRGLRDCVAIAVVGLGSRKLFAARRTLELYHPQVIFGVLAKKHRTDVHSTQEPFHLG